MIPAISLQGVSKQYDAFALQDVDLLLPEGQVMGLIGVTVPASQPCCAC